MADHASVRQCGDDELQAFLALWPKGDETVSLTDTLDDLRRAATQPAPVDDGRRTRVPVYVSLRGMM